MPASPEELQFDHAEFSGPGSFSNCAACKRPIGSVYYVANRHVICESCRGKIHTSRGGGSGLGRFLRAFGCGALAAALGAGLYFAIAAVTGYELGLVAIVVGFMVGGAVRWGSRGRGGWPYQTLAMALTYAAIVSTYIPGIIKEFSKEEVATRHQETTSSVIPLPAQATAPSNARSSAATTDAPSRGAERMTVSEPTTSASQQAADETVTLNKALLAWTVLFAIACVAPFLAGFQNIMGLIIIGIGLYEAWKINKRVRLEVTGPFSVASGSSSLPSASSS